MNSDHERNVSDMGLNWQITKYDKDTMKDCIMRYTIKSRWVNMYNKSTSAPTLWLVNLWNFSSTKTNNHYCPYPIHSISPKLYVKRVFMKIQYFKKVLKKFVNFRGEGGSIRIAHVSRSQKSFHSHFVLVHRIFMKF